MGRRSRKSCGGGRGTSALGGRRKGDIGVRRQEETAGVNSVGWEDFTGDLCAPQSSAEVLSPRASARDVLRDRALTEAVKYE